ncbi:hypothetical protein [Oceanivirga salmonicida]|uniref:hypothetical protein n=1 Tax=Oceanivirga salmonicida TaxID=1769291 RepID=UPI0012E2375E|nr:hypothetical protein [Oceanivirga salmonicida]
MGKINEFFWVIMKGLASVFMIIYIFHRLFMFFKEKLKKFWLNLTTNYTQSLLLKSFKILLSIFIGLTLMIETLNIMNNLEKNQIIIRLSFIIVILIIVIILCYGFSSKKEKLKEKFLDEIQIIILIIEFLYTYYLISSGDTDINVVILMIYISIISIVVFFVLNFIFEKIKNIDLDFVDLFCTRACKDIDFQEKEGLNYSEKLENKIIIISIAMLNENKQFSNKVFNRNSYYSRLNKYLLKKEVLKLKDKLIEIKSFENKMIFSNETIKKISLLFVTGIYLFDKIFDEKITYILNRIENDTQQFEVFLSKIYLFLPIIELIISIYLLGVLFKMIIVAIEIEKNKIINQLERLINMEQNIFCSRIQKFLNEKGELLTDLICTYDGKKVTIPEKINKNIKKINLNEDEKKNKKFYNYFLIFEIIILLLILIILI